ncbi:MAG: hypothetical protein NTY19_42110 [Planctomycetota bacterium]|nr:hypothetical protein [Planctomycetota bacterium]
MLALALTQSQAVTEAWATLLIFTLGMVFFLGLAWPAWRSRAKGIQAWGMLWVWL